MSKNGSNVHQVTWGRYTSELGVRPQFTSNGRDILFKLTSRQTKTGYPLTRYVVLDAGGKGLPRPVAVKTISKIGLRYDIMPANPSFTFRLTRDRKNMIFVRTNREINEFYISGIDGKDERVIGDNWLFRPR